MTWLSIYIYIYIHTHTGCIKMIGAVSIHHYGYQNARRSKFPHMEWNSRCPSFVRMRSPTPLFSLGLWHNKAIMATPEQKAFCVPRFVKHESVVSFQWAFRRQCSSDPPSPNSIRCWYQQFQTTGCFCKGKSAGPPRVSEESVERVRQSFLCSPKKRNICRHVS
jgi:hypothetical protein